MKERTTIEIQKPLGEESGGLFSGLFGSGRREEPSMPSEPAAAPSIHPLAGFWARAGAFILDGMLMYLLALVWVPRTQGFFLDHPLLLTPVALALFLAYLTVLNGPVGKGRTLGKALLQITTRQSNGAPLNWSQSALRAAVQLLPAILHSISLLVSHSVDPGAPQVRSAMITSVVLVIPALTLLAVNISLVVMAPDRRGLHDLLMGAITARAEAIEAAAQCASAMPSEARRRRLRFVWIMAALVAGLLAYSIFSGHESERRHGEFISRLWAGHSLEGFSVVTPRAPILGYFPPVGADDASSTSSVASSAGAPPSGLPATTGTPTTDSATTSGSLRRAFPVIYYRMGRVDKAQLQKTLHDVRLTTNVARWIEANREDEAIGGLIKELQENLAARADAQKTLPPEVVFEAVDVQFYESLPMPPYLGPRHGRLVLREQIPASIFPPRNNAPQDPTVPPKQ